jgi:alkanesulfonate monooxygenase SsuD/methylene tetrahydromethanopterin reductase-like flavin-dependent oxidoreductase (luciferase family)
MRIGIVILPDGRWSETRERWVRAEALGFDHAWTYDHLTWRELQNKPWFGSIPTLAAAAVVTSRMRLGTLVTSPNFRHPVTLGKELMSLDDISGGRMTIGIGAGGDGFDATALGTQAWTPRERADRLQEFIALLDTVLCEERSNYQGEFYSAVEARALPGCVQRPRPPFAIAGSGPRGMKLAVEHAAIWIGIDAEDHRGPPGESLEKMVAICEREGRDPASIGRLALTGFTEQPTASVEAFRDVVGRYDEMGFTDLAIHWPRTSEPFAADLKVLEDIADDVARLNA